MEFQMNYMLRSVNKTLDLKLVNMDLNLSVVTYTLTLGKLSVSDTQVPYLSMVRMFIPPPKFAC